MNKTILKILIAAVIAAGLGFYGGIKYGESANTQTSASQRFQQTGGFNMTNRNGNRSAGQNGNFAGGEIIAKDATSITVKLQDGSSKIVFVSSSTPVLTSVQGNLNDLNVGDNITVIGTQNSDGSITSQSIQIRPIGTPQR